MKTYCVSECMPIPGVNVLVWDCEYWHIGYVYAGRGGPVWLAPHIGDLGGVTHWQHLPGNPGTYLGTCQS